MGADRLAAELGYLGQGSVVAVVDTGIDYTHAAFGGPGTAEAYSAAARDAEGIDDTWDGRPLFPTERVIGGWDFVGPNYTTPALCPPDREATGACTSVPHPDPDPLDQGGHGTNVAGTVAGQAVGTLSRGVAPQAGLVALKIYGPPTNRGDTDETVDILIDALEWCVRANLGMAVPGIAPEAPLAIDVVNMSIGEPYAQGSRLFDTAVDSAVGAGMVVVAAAGNQGDRPYVVSAPGASPRALSVASISIGAGEGTDAMAGHSGRGPSKNGALKPDLAAPGSAVSAAAYATGVGATMSSGTSMSAPHVAGAAALLHERNRDESLGLSALELSALLMNYARPMLPELDGRDRFVPVSRQGAGRLDVAHAGTSDLVVTGGDIASLNIGAVSVTGDVAFDGQFNVRNLSDEAVNFELAALFADEADSSAGVELTLPEGVIPLRGKGAVDVPMAVRIAADSLRGWALRGPTPVNLSVLERLEIDGYVSVTPVDASGSPVADAQAAHVPFYVLPRRASKILPGVVDRRQLTFDNESPYSGDVELFVVPFGGASEDPDEADVEGELDVRRVGVRFEPGAGGETLLTFGISLHAVSVVPQVTAYELYLDLDRDGEADVRVRTAHETPLGDQIGVRVGDWNAETGDVEGPERTAGMASFDLHTRTAIVSVPLSAVGMEVPEPFDFYLISRGLTEDWWGLTDVDIVPNDIDGPCGRVLLGVDPGQWSNLPERWTLTVEGGGTALVTRSAGTGELVPRLMALLPDNRFEDPDGQLAVLASGADPEPMPLRGLCRAFLPVATRAHALKPLRPPDAMLANAIDEVSRISDIKMLSDIRNESVDEERKYRFRGPNGLHMTYSPRHDTVPGRDIERWDFMRIDDTAWVRKHVSNQYVEDWHCHYLAPDLLFWPDFVRRFSEEFPVFGWEIDGQGSFQGRTTWMLRNHGREGPWSFFARVDVENGRLLWISRFDDAGRSESYAPFDFGIVNESVGPIRNKPCP
jgi:subtilisin family serine protease